MATAAVISVHEYLHSTYHPDCDYVDGRVEERNLGEQEHAWVQGRILAWLIQHEAEWKLRVLPEQRVQVSATNFRVPDVTVVRDDDPFDPVIRKAPLICIEVMSSEDRINAVQVRLEDMRRMGVANIWLVDPATRAAFTYSARGLEECRDSFRVPGSGIFLPLQKVFAGLP